MRRDDQRDWTREGRLRGPASAPVVADYHPSKPVGALYFPTDLLPLASVKASFAACGKRSWAYALSEGEAGDEREELIAYNACGVCLCALVCAWCVLCVWCRVAGLLYGVHACVMWGRV